MASNVQQQPSVQPGPPQTHQQQQQQQQQPYGAQRTIPFSKSWHNTKIVLGSLSIVWCIIVLGISIALVVNNTIESPIIVWTAPPVIVGICWQIAEFITICARKTHRGIHPGAHVALHLLLWLGFAAATGLTATWLVLYADCDYYCRRYRSRYNLWNDTYLVSMRTLVAFLALLFLTHFFLFVRACVETAKRNSMPRVIMVPQPMYYPGPPGYQQPYQPGPGGAQEQHMSMPAPPPNAHYSGYYAPTPGGPQQHETKELHPQATGNSNVTNQTGHFSQPSQPNGTTISEADAHHGHGQGQGQYAHQNQHNQVSPA